MIRESAMTKMVTGILFVAMLVVLSVAEVSVAVAQTGASSSSPTFLLPRAAGGDTLRPITIEFLGQTPNSYYVNAPEVRERSALWQMYDSLAYSLQYLWDSLTTGLTPPSPTSFAKTFDEKDPNSFWYMISETGYKLKEIETDVSIIPNVGFKFKYVRQMSDADINYIERKLERHAKKFSDFGSKLQRSILATLLDINNSDSYYVETFTVKLLPIPRATFSLQPWEGGLPRELDVLLRAIQGKDNPYAHSPHGGNED
ncbi:hypothetical protein CCP2SC5_310014 [Azospirillaceae bacterium]